MAEEPLAQQEIDRGHDPTGVHAGAGAPTRAALASVYDAMPVGMAVWSVDGELAPGQPRVLRPRATSTAEELQGRRFDIVRRPARGRSDPRTSWPSCSSGQRNYVECEFRCRRPDGVDHWVTNMLTAVYGPSGRPDYLVSQIFDFSNPRTREARAYRLVNETPVLLWLTDRLGSPRIGNRTCFEFVGVSPEEEDLRAALLERMHRDDLAEVGDGIRVAIADRAPFEFTARVLRADGEYRWLHHRALPFFDADGELRGLRRRQPRRDRVRGAAPRARHACASCSRRSPRRARSSCCAPTSTARSSTPTAAGPTS